MEAVPLACNVRSLRLEVAVLSKPDVEEVWAEILRQALEHMQDLREVNLAISLYHDRTFKYPGTATDSPGAHTVFACLATFPLQVATVDIRDDCDVRHHPDDLAGRWTMAEKQKYSQHMRKALLRKNH